MQLQRLTGMEQQKILDELAEIQRRIAEYLEILGSDKVLRDLIVKELREVQKDYGDERRTRIEDETGEIRLEDLVAVEDVAITVTRGGYLKRTSVDTYRRQTRGGKGRIGMGTRAEDVVEYLIVASTHSYLLIFTTRGRVYWLKAYEIPDAATSGKGKHISNLISLQSDEEVRAIPGGEGFRSRPVRGDGDPARRDQEIGADRVRQPHVARHHRGDAGRGRRADRAPRSPTARTTSSWDRAKGRPSASPRGRCVPWAGRRAACGPWTWTTSDYLVGMEVVEKDGLILSIAENGFGKRTELEDYRLTNRGGKGVINMKTTSKTGPVVAILSVQEDTDLIIISQNGKIIRIESATIRQAGRSTQGVKLVTLEEGDKIAAASTIPDTPENGNGQRAGTCRCNRGARQGWGPAARPRLPSWSKAARKGLEALSVLARGRMTCAPSWR